MTRPRLSRLSVESILVSRIFQRTKVNTTLGSLDFSCRNLASGLISLTLLAAQLSFLTLTKPALLQSLVYSRQMNKRPETIHVYDTINTGEQNLGDDRLLDRDGAVKGGILLYRTRNTAFFPGIRNS